MKTWCSSPANLAKLIAVVYNDVCPEIADAAYLYGEEPRNEEPVLNLGKDTLTANTVKQLLFPGSDGVSLNGNTYSWQRWENQLLESIRFRNDRHKIVRGIPIVSEGTFWHTHIEAGKLIQYAATQGIKTLFVTAITTH